VWVNILSFTNVLHVTVPPTIASDSLDLKPRVLENSTVYIDCPAYGVPEPKVCFHCRG
jgi:hypothetical protein